MRTRLFLLFAFAAVTVLTNAASAGNIAHGVEVVVIDPGHGGNDPGAHYGGTSEKDLTLKVALKLGKMIEEGMPGVKVVYTRKTDKALGPDKAKDLQARADIVSPFSSRRRENISRAMPYPIKRKRVVNSSTQPILARSLGS